MARGDFCRLLITFANSLDPGQARQNVGPDLGPSCLNDIMTVIVQEFFKNLNFEKSQQSTTRAGSEVIKLFSCSTQLSTKFIMLINVKMPTIVGI